MSEETIAALATPPGHGGVAVIRVSGDRTASVLGRLVRRPPRTWQPRTLYHRTLVDEAETIDRGLVVFFQGPDSFTGEDAAEFHVHGNPFLIQTLLAAITREPGIRSARPGEFSYRAYCNGKMDLPEAEALNQLIAAQSDTAYRLSLNALSGGLSRLTTELRSALLDLAAWVETSIEFAEDHHLELDSLLKPLAAAREKVKLLLGRSSFYDHLTRGLHMVIAGPANAGKSSLFNALLGADRAIVSELPGTTRDVLRERFYLHHVAVELLDTAGINPGSPDPVEREGVERGLAALTDASALIFVVDASVVPQGWEAGFCRDFRRGPVVVLFNKSDLLNGASGPLWQESFSGLTCLSVSVKQGTGVGAVRDLLESWSERFRPSVDDVAVNGRQRELLEAISKGLDRVADGLQAGEMMELLAEEIRLVHGHLSVLIGETTPDDVLERVFSSFCIGK